MRDLFRSFNREGVRYLVISGQACVLYGAAHFSQDLDLWVEPTQSNLRRWMGALARLRARVHKLTPPIQIPLLEKGHGFHFVVPIPGQAPLYLDIMGQPPRVRGFRQSARLGENIESPLGLLPVVSIEDLVEIKKTNRPGDYDVITRLALIRLARESTPTPRLLRWAIGNIFRPEDLWEVILRFGNRLTPAILSSSMAVRLLHSSLRRGSPPSLRALERVGAFLGLRAAHLQARGRVYWSPRLRELRRLRAAGRLLAEGTLVSQLMKS